MRRALPALILLFTLIWSAKAQFMTLDEVISVARSQSVEALEAKSEFASDYLI